MASETMDVRLSCRCCLRCAPDKDLTTPYTFLGETETYVDMIRQCFGFDLLLADAGSNGVCFVCVARLRDASRFKLQVQRCQEELLGALPVQEGSAVKPVRGDEGAGGPEEIHALDDDPLAKPEAPDEEVGEYEEWLETDEEWSVKSETSDGAGSAEDGPTLGTSVYEDAESRVFPDAARQKPTCSENKGNNTKTLTKTYSEEVLYYCDECGKAFRIKADLTKHIQGSHSSLNNHPKAHTQISLTNHETGDKSHLLTHLRKHNGEKPFECGLCSCKFKNKSCLQRHQRRHTGEKQFQCGYCDYKSNEKANLQRHHRTHTGERPFECVYCGLKFALKSYLQQHKGTHTGEKRFKCSYCYYKCNDKSNLQKHQRIHSGEKPFKCGYCGLKFALKLTLQGHQRIHTGEKPFKCGYCNYKSNQKSALQRHQRRHTGENPNRHLFKNEGVYASSICQTP